VSEAQEREEEGLARRLEAGRRLFAQEARFILAAVKADQVPASQLPEVAFAGRSNVGKSSLVNALTGRRTLARTSGTPGRTQQLIFFELGGRLMLVDLPGYGYAKAPKQDVERWTRLTRSYLKGRPQLRRVLLLVDSRHGLKDVDRGVMRELNDAAVSYQLILTKSDKIKAPARARLLEATAAEVETHVAAHPQILLMSAEKGEGIERLRAELAALAAVEAPG